MIKTYTETVSVPTQRDIKKEYYCDVCKKLIIVSDKVNQNKNIMKKPIVTFTDSDTIEAIDCCSKECFDKIFNENKNNLFENEYDFGVDTIMVYGYMPTEEEEEEEKENDKEDANEQPIVLGINNSDNGGRELNKELFKIGMGTPFSVSKEAHDTIIEISNSSCSKETKHMIAMEELAECSQQISKIIRNEGDVLDLIEEIADVHLSLEMISKMDGITDDQLTQALNVKLDRERQRRTKPIGSIILTTNGAGQSKIDKYYNDDTIYYRPYGILNDLIDPSTVIQSPRFIDSVDFGSFCGYDIPGIIQLNIDQFSVIIASMKNHIGRIEHHVVLAEDEMAREILVKEYYRSLSY